MSVCLIHSSWSIPTIINFLKKHVNIPEDLGDIHVITDNEIETNKSIALFRNEAVEKLIDLGFGRRKFGHDFRISRVPLAKAQGRELLLTLPVELTSSECYDQIETMLNLCVKYDLISDNDFEIILFNKSRIEDQHSGYGIIEFSPRVRLTTVNSIRMLIDGSEWMSRKNVKWFEKVICIDKTCLKL